MNTSYDGAEIKQLISPSFVNCQAQCAIVNACVWFRFKRSDLAETCFLMSTKGAKSNDTDAVSGPPRCPSEDRPTSLCMQHVAYDGIPIPNVYKASVFGYFDWRLCQQKCFETKTCTFFTFNEKTQDCFLSDTPVTVLKLHQISGSIAGLGTCVNTTKKCIFQNATFYRDDLLMRVGVDNDYGTFENVTSCQEKCKNTEGCVWFMFSSTKRCQLLSARYTRLSLMYCPVFPYIVCMRSVHLYCLKVGSVLEINRGNKWLILHIHLSGFPE